MWIVGLAVMVMVLSTVMVMAQSVMTIERQGTVVDVFGDAVVVKGADGITRLYEVPHDFTFNVQGEQVPVTRLRPGMVLKGKITVLHEPKTVKVVSIKNGTVVRTAGTSVWVRLSPEDGGKVKRYVVPAEYSVDTGRGNRVPINQLRPGTKLTAKIVTFAQEMQPVAASMEVSSESKPAPAPAESAAPAPAPAPAPAAESAPAELPSTGSLVPAIGLGGLILVLTGLGLAVLRRFA
jgi:hypothetical protein